MATEFTVSVKSAAGDYSSLNAAMAGVVAAAADLTLGTIKVFSVSSVTSPTIAAGDAVLGLTSAATGTCVLVNTAGTQILIKGIGGTFQSGETVKKLTDVTKEVVLSNAGDSPIIGVCCFGFVDTTAVGGVTCVTSATNYVRVYADSSAVATMPYTSTGYRLEITGGFQHAVFNQDYIRIERLSFKSIPGGGGNNTITLQAGAAGDVRIVGCLVQLVPNAAATAGSSGIYTTGTVAGCLKIINCVLYNFDFTNGVNNVAIVSQTTASGQAIYYNCTLYNCKLGTSSGGAVDPKIVNCLYDAAGISSPTAFSGVGSGSDYNAATVAGLSGAHSRSSQTFTYINAGTGDFHLASGDAGAKGFGVDLSADATYPFSTDFDGVTRTVPWDIGATKAAAGAATPVLLDLEHTQQYQVLVAQ